MIVFSLCCYEKHAFDGWFRSSEDFHSQLERRLVECPVCGDTNIVKLLSAPRINLGATAGASQNVNHSASSNLTSSESRELSRSGASAAHQMVRPGNILSSDELAAATAIPGLQQHMLRQFTKFVLANTENVGTAFAETARRMHHGEEYLRSIRGQVSVDDAIALQDEGIDTMQLPSGAMMDEGLQ